MLRLLVMCMVWHFCGWKCMSQSDSHRCRESRSSWRAIEHRCQPSRIRRDSPAFSSDVPRNGTDVPHFLKMVLLFFPLRIILHVCLGTQHSDELPIKLVSYFAHRQMPSIFHERQPSPMTVYLFTPPTASTLLPCTTCHGWWIPIG